MIHLGKLKRTQPFYVEDSKYLKSLAPPEDVKFIKITMSNVPAGIQVPKGASALDSISHTLVSMQPNQLMEVLAQMNFVINQPDQARQAPQLSYSLFQTLLLNKIGARRPRTSSSSSHAPAAAGAEPDAAADRGACRHGKVAIMQLTNTIPSPCWAEQCANAPSPPNLKCAAKLAFDRVERRYRAVSSTVDPPPGSAPTDLLPGTIPPPSEPPDGNAEHGLSALPLPSLPPSSGPSYTVLRSLRPPVATATLWARQANRHPQPLPGSPD
ncbi:hypothetical protein HYPSUDRAFT_209445 [Hypholoma sublateritium FD-334 SS-4]|uniref:Cleavage stimulation factor subunit 2 hinge domain-containing protein n=1 Tax=Hypholoma sublateritium (strain FD-334 SS-4) TaxID=945553 RepID=A0A0D2KG97_HYPSF|nr:hypothetical protein HYPSUDRAFT_209445 [Hypholoma sublateritium FD-334 SS-4]